MGGGGARGRGGEWYNRSILDCSDMMTVLCVQCTKHACFVKAYYRPFEGCFRWQQHDGGIALFMRETTSFAKAYDRQFVGCDCSPRLVVKQTCWNSALSLGIWEDR